MIAEKDIKYAGARRRLKLACAACFVASAGAATQATAQEGGEARDERRFEVDEVVVTARKVEERLIDVPLTVNVITEAAINDANIVEFEDIATLTPGLELSSGLGRQTENIIIRGLAPVGFTSADTVPVYVDGFTLGFSRVQNNAQYFDLERIEVLKGPQGTLYGGNSLGGVIHMITKKPGKELASWVKASYGNYDARELAASVSGPVSERLSMGVAARYAERDGYWDNTFTGESGVDDESDEAAQFQLRAIPNDRATIDLRVAYSASDDGCGNCPNTPIPGYSRADRPAIGRGEVDFNSPTSTVNQDVDGGFDRETWIASLNAEFDLGNMVLNSITGYGDTDAFLVLDLISAPGPAFGVITSLSVERTSKVLSQELRLSSNTDGRLQWLAGLYAYQAELGRISRLFFTFNPAGAFSTNSFTDLENYAVFGNIDYSLTDRWSLGLGLRWDYLESKIDDRLATIRFFSQSGDEVMPKVSISYRPNADLHWYASVARGYKSGGFNNFEQPGVPRNFDPEFVRHFEVGVKGNAWENRLRYDLAAYFIDWQDRQRVGTNLTGQDFVINQGSTTAKGLEATISLVPFDGLTLQASAALMDSELKDIVDRGNSPAEFGWNADYSGNSLPFAPDVTLAASSQYIRAIEPAGWDLRLRADVRYTGEREFHEAGFLTQDPYAIANVYVGMQNERWEVGVFADNLFDEAYHASGDISSGIGPQLYRGDPRTYGIRMRADF